MVYTPAVPQRSKAPVLLLRHVCKRYGSRAVLDGVGFEIAAGERVALMGPSGAGKSTLLNCIAGIDRPDSGDIVVAGSSLGSLNGEELGLIRRQTVTTVFQFFHLLPTLTAAENVEFPLQVIGLPLGERRERVEGLLQAVGVHHRRNAWPEELSGGEMQRVAIARALAPRPALILADEPTGNLDSRTGEAILDLLAALGDAQSFALLLVTHSRRATRICRRVLRLRDGRLLGEGDEPDGPDGD